MKDNNYIYSERLKNSVFISGSARSGTTILGKIIATFENVEYFFEPPLLFELFSKIEPKELYKNLIRTYLYEELYMGAISGRAINLRRQDDSCIYNYKTEEEIKNRLNSDARKKNLLKINNKIAFKIPDFVYKEGLIKKSLPETNIVRMIRNPEETINSLLEKKWFSDEGIRRPDIIWPNHAHKDYFVPHWLGEKDYDSWGQECEVNRCLIYYITQTEYKKDLGAVIDYSFLINNPIKVINELCEKLNYQFGPLTLKMLQLIKPQKTTNNILPKNTNTNYYNMALNLYNECISGYNISSYL